MFELDPPNSQQADTDDPLNLPKERIERLKRTGNSLESVIRL